MKSTNTHSSKRSISFTSWLLVSFLKDQINFLGDIDDKFLALQFFTLLHCRNICRECPALVKIAIVKIIMGKQSSKKQFQLFNEYTQHSILLKLL